MSKIKQLLSIIETWRDPEEDPTGHELLKDEVNEYLHGKKKLSKCSLLAQLCIAEAEEADQHRYNEILAGKTGSTIKKELIEGASHDAIHWK